MINNPFKSLMETLSSPVWICFPWRTAELITRRCTETGWCRASSLAEFTTASDRFHATIPSSLNTHSIAIRSRLTKFRKALETFQSRRLISTPERKFELIARVSEFVENESTFGRQKVDKATVSSITRWLQSTITASSFFVLINVQYLIMIKTAFSHKNHWNNSLLNFIIS